MSDTWDPWEHASEEDRNDRAVRSHLYAQRRLAELDTVDTKAKVKKMLAEVVAGPKVCGMATAPGVGNLGEGSKQRAVCGKPGVRMIALTGTWTCEIHDPLRQPYWGKPCCIRKGEE